MPVDWRKYQESAATYFRSIGLTADVEYQVTGARATHEIDVFVQGNTHGIAFRWIIECKAWKSSIPKEKVLALASIVQDTGADRGFLLSEAGFQAGAISASRNTNITLSSLDTLICETDGYLIEAAMANLNWRIRKAQERIRAIKKKHFNDQFMPPTLEPLSWIGWLDTAFMEASRNEFPVAYLTDHDSIYEAANIDELLSEANRLVSLAETWRYPQI